MFGRIAPIHFAFDSFAVLPPHERSIEQAAAVLNDQRCRGREVALTGHADYMGGTLYNQALSIRRATVVVDALVAKGVDAGRLTVTALGEKSPDVADLTDDARARNRRVVMTMTQ